MKGKRILLVLPGCYKQVDFPISHHHQGFQEKKTYIRLDKVKQAPRAPIIRFKRYKRSNRPRILNSCTWLPPWRWQGYKPTGWCRSSGFPGESIHMLLTRCLICSESTRFANNYYGSIRREKYREKNFHFHFFRFIVSRSCRPLPSPAFVSHTKT